MRRIGIYAGTFDPVHAGHVTFALQAMEHAGLDRLYFLPERQPRHKKDALHFGHRVAMLRRAVRPHPNFSVLELDDISLNVRRTLPKLQQQFKGDQLVFLFGSDTIKHLSDWPLADRLLSSSELVVGVRSQNTPRETKEIINSWPVQPKAATMFASHIPSASSSKIRNGLRRRHHAEGTLTSVQRYSNRNWLYVSVA